jgi:hypothetical protein
MCKAGGDSWLKRAALSTAWKAGFDDTSGNVSDCDGVGLSAGNAGYDDWDCGAEC